MKPSDASAARLVEGRVDVSQPHFELCYGSGDDDPDTWIAVARVASDDENRAVVEITLDPTRADFDALARSARSRVVSVVSEPKDDGRSGIIWLADPDGRPVYGWALSLAQACGFTANWYGKWHWRGRKGATGSE